MQFKCRIYNLRVVGSNPAPTTFFFTFFFFFCLFLHLEMVLGQIYPPCTYTPLFFIILIILKLYKTFIYIYHCLLFLVYILLTQHHPPTPNLATPSPTPTPRHVVQRILFLMSMFFRCLSALVWLCATQCTTFSPDCISPLFNIRCVFDDKILKDDFCQFFIKI